MTEIRLTFKLGDFRQGACGDVLFLCRAAVARHFLELVRCKLGFDGRSFGMIDHIFFNLGVGNIVIGVCKCSTLLKFRSLVCIGVSTFRPQGRRLGDLRPHQLIFFDFSKNEFLLTERTCVLHTLYLYAKVEKSPRIDSIRDVYNKSIKYH